ncbi:ABC-2 type transport system permease protein [Thiogranum longum]|uniref:Transport permease protein n=1 Tax=Thiogranum longum TaxID=1537524 RepID=A0A4R1HCD5_9GAMM|nr:ABC transporter permease [Thiogranum longum]TCK18203.1 ABC-2 type transport system permease protein [Thiogranum longum]
MTLKEKYIGFETILIKEILRFARIWLQTIVPPVITMSLYFIIFGNLIGSQIGDMDGFRYMDYIVPGLIMMAVINNSYANVVSSFYGCKFHHHIEEMLVSPLPNSLIIAGFVTGGVARGLAVGLAVTLVSMLFTDLSWHNLAVVISTVVLTSTVFALAGLINGIFAKSFDDISIIPTFVLTPLTYLGGVFYTISMLPEFWQNVSKLNPILYMVNTFRYGFLGISDISLTVSYTIISIFIVALFSLALYLMNTGYGIRR